MDDDEEGRACEDKDVSEVLEGSGFVSEEVSGTTMQQQQQHCGACGRASSVTWIHGALTCVACGYVSDALQAVSDAEFMTLRNRTFLASGSFVPLHERNKRAEWVQHEIKRICTVLQLPLAILEHAKRLLVHHVRGDWSNHGRLRRTAAAAVLASCRGKREPVHAGKLSECFGCPVSDVVHLAQRMIQEEFGESSNDAAGSSLASSSSSSSGSSSSSPDSGNRSRSLMRLCPEDVVEHVLKRCFAQHPNQELHVAALRLCGLARKALLTEGRNAYIAAGAAMLMGLELLGLDKKEQEELILTHCDASKAAILQGRCQLRELLLHASDVFLGSSRSPTQRPHHAGPNQKTKKSVSSALPSLMKQSLRLRQQFVLKHLEHLVALDAKAAVLTVDPPAYVKAKRKRELRDKLIDDAKAGILDDSHPMNYWVQNGADELALREGIVVLPHKELTEEELDREADLCIRHPRELEALARLQEKEP
eukprot:ANDGO_03271.mRNA.1 hypothetical protein